jgi:hypothetical protein
MLTSQDVKEYAKACGADLCGIASMDRFEGAPLQCDPRQIAPDAKSMIVLGFRILRGALRGIEEGTYFTAYAGMGYAGINFVRMPVVIWELCNAIEDAGYETVPIPNNFPWNATNVSGWVKGVEQEYDPAHTRPVAPGRAAPDVFIQLRIAAFCAGLGEIGWSKMFLTPEFGPRQRIGAIITDAPLEPDPIYDGPPLCDRCMACVQQCSGSCLPADKSVKVTVAGRELEWADIDFEQCSKFFCGAAHTHNPFMCSAEDEEGFNQPVWEAQRYKMAPMYEYGRALEGASGCIRACMIHLEEQGKLKNKFEKPFRVRKPWRLERDW